MYPEKRKPRIIIGSVGLDPHYLGMELVSQALRDAGLEVIYLGPFSTAERIVEAAIQEDVQVIGLSDHCGAMPMIASEVLELLKKKGASLVHIVAGGLLSDEDRQALEAMGVQGNWRGGTPLHEIVDYITNLAEK